MPSRRNGGITKPTDSRVFLVVCGPVTKANDGIREAAVVAPSDVLGPPEGLLPVHPAVLVGK